MSKFVIKNRVPWKVEVHTDWISFFFCLLLCLHYKVSAVEYRAFAPDLPLRRKTVSSELFPYFRSFFVLALPFCYWLTRVVPDKIQNSRKTIVVVVVVPSCTDEWSLPNYCCGILDFDKITFLRKTGRYRKPPRRTAPTFFPVSLIHCLQLKNLTNILYYYLGRLIRQPYSNWRIFLPTKSATKNQRKRKGNGRREVPSLNAVYGCLGTNPPEDFLPLFLQQSSKESKSWTSGNPSGKVRQLPRPGAWWLFQLPALLVSCGLYPPRRTSLPQLAPLILVAYEVSCLLRNLQGTFAIASKVPLHSGSNDIRMMSVPCTHNWLGERSFTATSPQL